MPKKEIKKWSAHEIFQATAVIRNRQARDQIDHQLQKQVKEQIDAWGGIVQIDKFLTEKDPDHSLLSEVQGINWKFLGRKVDKPNFNR